MDLEYALQITRGINAGKTWRITRTPMAIGRSVECPVRISDATISRRHCEVWLDDDGPHIRDLKSSNETIVNGTAVSDCLLKPNDEIQLGPFLLRVVQVESPASPESLPKDIATPATLALANGFFVQTASNEADSPTALPHESHFRGLLQCHQEFARCASVECLASTLASVLKKQFDPEAWWLVRAIGSERKLAPHPHSSSMVMDTALMRDIQKAIESKSGFLIPRRRTLANKPSIETTLIAPLIVVDEQIGAMAIRSGTPQKIYDESDLEFFLGLAHSFAPYLVAVEQAEQLRRDLERMRTTGAVDHQLIGSSAAMTQVRNLAIRAAKSDLPVLLLGETGTGKEVVARMIHEHSDRAKQPYVIVNAASIPRELFESEMFGYEKGAFTGAVRQKIGYFEEAHNGTFFLDEIGDLSAENQARILRVIETGRFNRVGGTREIAVDVRIVSATNRKISGSESSTSFRQDLYHRLSGFVISIPALRDRKSDIPELVDYFLERTKSSAKLTFSSRALDKLAAYRWPGNVRELRACVERSSVLVEGPIIEPEDIMISQKDKPDPDSSSSHILSLADAERHHIQRILKQHNGNIRSTAQALKISRVTLYKKINDYNIPY